LVSWCKKGPPMLRSSASSLQFNRTCLYIHNSHPSHYNSLSNGKFFFPESPQVHSHIACHWTTYRLNINLNTISSLSALDSHLNLTSIDLIPYLHQKTLYNDKWLWQENVLVKQRLVQQLQFTCHFVAVSWSLVTCSVKQITVIIVFLTVIFNCYDRTFQLVKQVPGSKPLLKATSGIAMSIAPVLVYNGYLNHTHVNCASV
jgi:hypothetical protein